MTDQDDLANEIAALCDAVRKALELSIESQARITSQLKLALESLEMVKKFVEK